MVEIGDYAFDGCTNLVSIEIPASVTSAGGYAFPEHLNTGFYTVVFEDAGEVEISTKSYRMGEKVVVPADPETKTGECNPEYHCIYVFAGWDKEITAVSGNDTYTATYDEVEVSSCEFCEEAAN